MSALFDPLTIGNVEFANRIWVSPMCQYMAEDGFVGQWHDVHLGSFATGGTGLIMVEATGVVPEGRISIGCPSIEDEAHAQAFKPMIDFAHSHDVKIGIQLAHAGRKAGTMLPRNSPEAVGLAMIRDENPCHFCQESQSTLMGRLCRLVGSSLPPDQAKA